MERSVWKKYEPWIKTIEKLKEEAKKLSARRNDVQTKIRDKTKHAMEECVVWIVNVNKLEKDVEMLIASYMVEKNKINGVHFDLNRSLKEKYDAVLGCWAEGCNFATGAVTIEKPPEPVIKMRAPKIDDKPSLHGIVEKVLVSLRNEHVKRIGLWRMVGVGKTTILENLTNNDQIAGMFDIVIFATVTGEGDEGRMKCPNRKLLLAREKLQHDIARRLKMNVESITNIEAIASKVSVELAGRKCLLLLDDVWGMLDLEDVGIHGMENSKIVFATRRRYILNDMDVDEEINVKPVAEADARMLFMEKLGQKVDLSFNKTTLFHKRNYNLETIPELCFEHMCSVEVLDLHGTRISALPRSLSCLTSLKAIYVDSCEQLMELLSTIEALEHLEVLGIQGTGIDLFSLPIGNLSRLRPLRLS